MKKHSTRRLFIQNTIMASIACAVFPAVAINASSKEELNSTELKSNLKTGVIKGKDIIVKGKIYDKTGVVIRNDVSIEVWHLSTSSKKYEYYKNITPNHAGEYQFSSVVPEKELGKLPRLHFKIATKEKSYNTELIINNFGAYISDKHWELNKQLGDNVFPVKTDFNNYSELQFNLSI